MSAVETKKRYNINKIGAHAIQHKDGWWVGNDEGVFCYDERFDARLALTIIWQREGGKKLEYSIKPFTGADVLSGEHTPEFSAEEALQRYERTKPRRPIRS